MKHSEYLGGSSAERRFVCAASFKLEEGIPSPPASKLASQGTALHAAMVRHVRDGEPVDRLARTGDRYHNLGDAV